jgi:hypothetical protein
MINDAYRALELLAKHPRIDAGPIGIMRVYGRRPCAADKGKSVR